MASTNLLSYAICVLNRPPFSPHKQTDGISCCIFISTSNFLLKASTSTSKFQHCSFPSRSCTILLGRTAAQRSDLFGKKCAHRQLASHFDGGWFFDLVSAHHQMAFLEAPENIEQKYAIFAGGVFMPSTCDLV